MFHQNIVCTLYALKVWKSLCQFLTFPSLHSRSITELLLFQHLKSLCNNNNTKVNFLILNIQHKFSLRTNTKENTKIMKKKAQNMKYTETNQYWVGFSAYSCFSLEKVFIFLFQCLTYWFRWVFCNFSVRHVASLSHFSLSNTSCIYHLTVFI